MTVEQEQQEQTAVDTNNPAPETTDTTETTEKPDVSVTEDGNDNQSEEKLLAGKYKSVEDLEKGYRELSKIARESKVEVPDEYSFDGVEGLDAESDMLKGMLPAFKEAGLSQEQVNSLVSKYAEHEASLMTDPEAELAKLGQEGKDRLQRINAFIDKNQVGLSDAELSAMKDSFFTAEQITAFEKIVDAVSSRTIPTEETGEVAGDPDELINQAMELKKSPQFDRLPANKEKYDSLMKQAAKLRLAKVGK